MKKEEVQLSSEFKAQATKAIVAIALFLLTYMVVLLLGIGLTALCIAGGVFIIALKPMFITFILGVGLSSVGVLIMIFLLKFIFKSHKTDRSHLIEIHKSDEPDLFEMIDEIVKKIGTRYPKKVYLSSDVNAAVFYDSSFWSMFLPINKNLQIGLGLVNTVTKEELKAILSHEFGHFSQRTMKIGSYVYNVNQVIFNMLYDNDGYDSLIQRWANISGYFSFFIKIAVSINEAIQELLKELYQLVNKSYLALSREMEFHADEIAASITGYEPLKNALMRMSLADTSFDNVLNFYNGKISEKLKSENIYREQSAVFKLIADANNFPMFNELPNISFEEQSKFDKSKLVIKNQWASHPSTKERIQRLEKTGYSAIYNNDLLANSLFNDIERIQKQLTKKLFEAVNYEGETTCIPFEKFLNEYNSVLLSNSFSKIYNGYYDNKNPTLFDLNDKKVVDDDIDFSILFSDEKVDMVYTAIALQNDIETIKNISNNTIDLKTFDYDGIRYKHTNADDLIINLNVELANLNEQINKNDKNIYEYFKSKEVQLQATELDSLYLVYFDFDKGFDDKYDIYLKLIRGLEFVNITTPFEQIIANLETIEPIEIALKSEIQDIMSSVIYHSEITEEIKLNFEKYLSQKWEYFNVNQYNDENLNILYMAMHNYAFLLSRGYFLMKKNLLNYQEVLLKKTLVKKTIQ